MTLYLHGSWERARGVFSSVPPLVRLRTHHIAQLGPNDVILSPRPWSPLLEALVFGGNERRPRIVQVADGIAFPLNARKRVNRRYGGLQRKIFADVFIVVQNKEDFELVTDEPELVVSARSVHASLAPIRVRQDTVVLVTGNDMTFGLGMGVVQAAFSAALRQLRRLQVRTVLLSSPSRRFTRSLQRRHPEVQSIGRLSDSGADLRSTLVIGSPSTVLLDHLASGGATLLLGLYDDPVLARYFSTTDALGEAQGDGTWLEFTARAATDVESSRVDLTELLRRLDRRPALRLGAGDLASALSARVLLGEARELLVRRRRPSEP